MSTHRRGEDPRLGLGAGSGTEYPHVPTNYTTISVVCDCCVHVLYFYSLIIFLRIVVHMTGTESNWIVLYTTECDCVHVRNYYIFHDYCCKLRCITNNKSLQTKKNRLIELGLT